MKKSRLLFALIALSLAQIFHAGSVAADIIPNDFDMNTGTNTYVGGLSDISWVTGSFYGLSPNAGSQAFLSAYFNANGFGLTKDLGGVVEDVIYDVSFYIASYSGNPVSFSDFTKLNIGALGGTTDWTSTPALSVQDTWFLWEGKYTPTAAEVGNSFVFEFQFGPTSGYDVGFDGAIVASAVPVPAAVWLLGSGIIGLVGVRRKFRKP